MAFRRFLVIGLLLLSALPAGAQTPAPAPAGAAGDGPLAQLLRNVQDRLECLSLQHCQLTGNVEIDLSQNSRFSADQVDIYTDPNLRLVASGNVVFASAEGSIAAERVEYNITTGLGTFHTAFGSMTLSGADRAQFGNQDPDVYFHGQTIEKVGARSYRIEKGGFTTCVQPTPRWEIVSSSVVLNLDEYAIARNMVFRVKGMPLLYLPVIYYPIQDSDRATGFLMPTYGSSTVRGQALSNAFFWVLGRSQDVTLFHDWFTRAGHGAGAEYRYVAGPTSFGNVRFYRFGQKETAFTEEGTTTVLPAETSYKVEGAGSQGLGRFLRAYQRVDYTTDLRTQQLYQQNIYQASNATRRIEAGLSGNWPRLSASAIYQRTETFAGSDASNLYGSSPRVSASVAPARLPGTPAYVALTSDYGYLPNRSLRDGVVVRDSSLGRLDVQPRIQAAVSRLSFLSVNTLAAYRMTYFNAIAGSETDGTGTTSVTTDGSVLRRYLSLRTEAIGPVLAKIWDTPDSGFSQRMKHVIEPTFVADYVSEIANAARIPTTVDASDRIVGGSLKFTYGLNNRLFYRARAVDGAPTSAVEMLSIGLQQTFYFDPLASLTDTEYVSSSLRIRPVDLSDVALIARLTPRGSSVFDATTRLEYDVHGEGFHVITTGIGARTPFSQTVINYSRRSDDRTDQIDSSLGGSTNVTLMQGRVTGGYAITWDIGRSRIISQNIGGAYLAQCCGIEAEFQKFQYSRSTPGFPSADNRFNVSFVLAGLGTFSNFFGALDGLLGAGR